CQQYNDLLFTS
nr:immunoglobulin light chain junction region [Macaca mulatta]